MRVYLLRRVLLLVPTLLIASFFVAGIARVMPGDALQAYLGAGRGRFLRPRRTRACDTEGPGWVSMTPSPYSTCGSSSDGLTMKGVCCEVASVTESGENWESSLLTR